MSKKQRDSLYAEVQKHQQSHECVVAGAHEENVDMADQGSTYRRGSTTTLSDLDDITMLPEGLLFDLPLTPEDGGDYCSLDMMGGSAGSSSSSQSSPEQTNLDFVGNYSIKHEYQLLHESGLFSQPEGCSVLEIGQNKHTNNRISINFHIVEENDLWNKGLWENWLMFTCLGRITQSVVKSHFETSQHSTEELKRLAWTLYSPEETRSYQTKVCEKFHFPPSPSSAQMFELCMNKIS